MGRTRRDCPILGCKSKNLTRLANHLDQIHHMDIEERAKWLQWSKMGLKNISNDAKDTERSELENMNTIDQLLHCQDEMEKKLNLYFHNIINDEKKVCKKPSLTNTSRVQWLSW